MTSFPMSTKQNHAQVNSQEYVHQRKKKPKMVEKLAIMSAILYRVTSYLSYINNTDQQRWWMKTVRLSHYQQESSKRRKITAFKAFLLRVNSLTSDSELHAAAAYQLHSDKDLVNGITQESTTSRNLWTIIKTVHTMKLCN